MLFCGGARINIEIPPICLILKVNIILCCNIICRKIKCIPYESLSKIQSRVKELAFLSPCFGYVGLRKHFVQVSFVTEAETFELEEVYDLASIYNIKKRRDIT